MKNVYLFGILFLISLSFISAAIENEILIVDDSDALAWLDEITSVSYYQNIIGNISNNGFSYNITIWNQTLSGSPNLNYLQSFGTVIWTTGSFSDSAPSGLDITILENYIEQGGNLMISGTYILYDWSQNSFTDNVLHANDATGPRSTDINDINITNISHTIMENFGQNEILNFIASPGGYNYRPNIITNVVNGGQTIAVQGPTSSQPGTPVIVVFENITTTAKTLFLDFPIFLLNETNRTILVESVLIWMDKYAPTINAINFAPSNADEIDPDVQINVTVNITDLHNVSAVIFSYKCAAGAGLCTPGTDTFTNITMIYNSTTGLYENVSFTPDVPGTWQYRIWSNDSLGNQNYSVTYNLSVEYDYSWTRTPAIFNSISCLFSETCTLGNLTINNTGDFTLNFDLSSNYEDTSYNVTEPFDLAAKQFKIIQVNATAGTTASETNIIITINATTTNAEPSLDYTNVTFISYVGGAYLSNSLGNYVTQINQSESINLSGSVENIGSEDALNTTLEWIMPSSDWLNASGNLTQNIGNLTEGSTGTNDVVINISSSVSPGVYTIYLNSTCNASNCSDIESFSISVSCSNTDGICGTGCGYLTDSDCTQEVITLGGGGGGGSGVAKPFKIEFSQIIEILRGEEDSFNIEVKNPYKNVTLENLTLSLVGFLSQYVIISPEKIEKIESNQSKNFTVKLKIPSYKGYEEFVLNATINGRRLTKSGESSYTEKQHIKLIVQEITLKESNLTVIEAEKAIDFMREKNFNVKNLEEILKQAKDKLSNRQNNEAEALAQKIIDTKEKAFIIYDLISKIKEALENPRKIKLITGSLVRESGVSQKNVLTGNSILKNSAIEDILNLAIAAFERGDYDLAEERIESAKVLFLLETKGNFGLFLFLYWYFVLFGILLFSTTGIFGYRKHQKLNITKKIEDINKEEDNLEKLIIQNQQDYFSGKISVQNYRGTIAQHQRKLTKIKKRRLNLRNKRMRLLQSQQILQDLKIEHMQVENEIKRLQKEYYVDEKISKKEYLVQFKALNERVAELEGEEITLQLLQKKGKIKNKKSFKKKSEKNLTKTKFQENKPKLSYKFNNLLKKIKRKITFLFFKLSKKDKRGIMFIDDKFIEQLKGEAKKKNLKGKWVHIKLKKEEENEI